MPNVIERACPVLAQCRKHLLCFWFVCPHGHKDPVATKTVFFDELLHLLAQFGDLLAGGDTEFDQEGGSQLESVNEIFHCADMGLSSHGEVQGVCRMMRVYKSCLNQQTLQFKRDTKMVLPW